MAFALALLIEHPDRAFWMPTRSMEPTLMPGDRVIVAKVPYYFGDPQQATSSCSRNPIPRTSPTGAWSGDRPLVGAGTGLLAPDHPDYIKRVIGEPGDTVWARRRERLRERRQDLRAVPPRRAADGPLPQDEGPRGQAVRDGRQPQQLLGLPVRARVRPDRSRDRKAVVVSAVLEHRRPLADAPFLRPHVQGANASSSGISPRSSRTSIREASASPTSGPGSRPRCSITCRPSSGGRIASRFSCSASRAIRSSSSSCSARKRSARFGSRVVTSARVSWLSLSRSSPASRT